MHGTQRRMLETLRRVDGIVGANPLPAAMTNLPAGFDAQVRALKEAIATADSLAAEQQSGVPQLSTAARRALRSELRSDHLVPLRNVARVLERTMPGMPHIVNVPKTLKNEQSLLAAASAALRDIAPHKDMFLQKALPDDFLEQLQASIDAINNAKSESVAARSRVLSATAGIRTAVRRGRDAVHCLDNVVRRCCKADPVNGPSTLANWESARRIRRVGTATPTTPAPVAALAPIASEQ